MSLNPRPSQLCPTEWSPNQIAKREQIVRAASRIMATDGVHACTARSVSLASGLSTSAIHYYFKDTDEICDLAFRRIMDRFFKHVQFLGQSQTDPVASLWAACQAYLERGSDAGDGKISRGAGRAPMLWFEFQAQSLRTGELDTVRELSARGAKYFAGLLDVIGGAAAAAKAETLYCALLGASIRDSLFHRPPADYVAEIITALSLPHCATKQTLVDDKALVQRKVRARR